MQKGDLMELNFEGLEIQKLDTQSDRAQRVDKNEWGHLSSHHVYFQIYGH